MVQNCPLFYFICGSWRNFKVVQPENYEYKNKWCSVFKMSGFIQLLVWWLLLGQRPLLFLLAWFALVLFVWLERRVRYSMALLVCVGLWWSTHRRTTGTIERHLDCYRLAIGICVWIVWKWNCRKRNKCIKQWLSNGAFNRLTRAHRLSLRACLRQQWICRWSWRWSRLVWIVAHPKWLGICRLQRSMWSRIFRGSSHSISMDARSHCAIQMVVDSRTRTKDRHGAMQFRILGRADATNGMGDRNHPTSLWMTMVQPTCLNAGEEKINRFEMSQ